MKRRNPRQTILNCTPHTINIHVENGIISMASSGVVPRVSTSREPIGEIDGIPIDQVVYGDVSGLPEQEDNVFLVVSTLVSSAVPDREDLLVVGETIRQNGVVVGCIGLSRPA